ncbi:flagellar biosynthesis protein FlhA [Pikeienuella piscinae]|uniref:Flagellar biosynthesis protein FlhA n=1 Tax=Pikeienuella piscinae TaxID=2748098 RepID=A0A7L5C1I0_9RHOB|nr:flagellar biosynthesis protein FlhA [Pikeienuella piscinae]QIE56988.1 flagellar biosynthesis protein FlhA [Pikeienuella piscinae]
MDVSKLYQPTIMLALALLAVIVMMILPIPALLLDLGLTLSFGLSILVFTNTLFINRPLDFSAFPTVLLASLMLRLSLNVSSTKLIIGEGHNGPHAAGEVIEGFAMFVMGGSIWLGLVVFGVLLIVNFIVITKGAGRMAEVGARFALDGMPGRQLAIDSDMAAGAISHEEARAKRKTEQEETTFFGSLDGASKFVKGDAVAGLLITLLNLVVGLAMGVLVHGMPIGEAFSTYAILTVGDGLVNQIPAVIISIAAALLLSKGGVLGSTDKALFSQLGGFPGALATVAGLMMLLALVPGLPMTPFLLGAVLLGAAAWAGARRAARLAIAPPSEAVAKRPEKKVGDLLDLDEIHVEFAADMVDSVMDEATGLGNRITNMRNHIVALYGVVIPEIRLTDDIELASGSYVIRIQGVEMARATLRPGRVLVLLGDEPTLAPAGEDAAEPVYGAPARWISSDDQESAALNGFSVITPTEVVATHLLEIVKSNFGRLFTRRALRKLLEEFAAVSDPARAAANRRLLDEFIPDKAPIDLVQTVLRRLLEEQVSVRNLPLILEAIQEAKQAGATPDAIVEHVRRRLGFQLVAGLTEEDGALPIIQLRPEWEELFTRHQTEVEGGIADVALPPSEFNRLAGSIAEKVAEAGREGRVPVIATSSTRRRFLRTVLEAKGVRNAVLSFDEIGVNARPALIGVA